MAIARTIRVSNAYMEILADISSYSSCVAIATMCCIACEDEDKPTCSLNHYNEIMQLSGFA